MLRNRQAIGTRSIYSRMMRLVIPIVMGTSLIIGLVALIAIRAVAQDSLTQNHHAQLDDLVRDLSAAIEARVSDLDALAQGRDARNFARDTLINSGNQASQTRLLGDFTSLLEQNPTYLALRYVTFNGSVWSEVTNYDGTIPRPDPSIRLAVLADDPALTQALEIQPGQVVMSDVTYQLDPNAPILVPNVLYMRLSAPVSPDNSFNSSVAGVIQLDVRAAPLLEAARQAADRAAALQDGRRVIVSNSQGQILYDTANPTIDYARAFARRQSPMLAEQYPNAAAMLQPNAPILDAHVDGGSIFSTLRIPFTSSSGGAWTATLVDSVAQIANTSNLLSLAALVGSLLVGATISFLISLVLQRTLGPVASVTRWAVEGAAAGAPVDSSAADEVTQLTQAFQSISERVEALQSELVSQQGRYSRNLELAANISRETATLYDIDQLLNRAIDLICSEYGFYHAQVFLIDDVAENAVLVYSRGELGKRLLESGLKIPVGSRSMIGTVATTGQALVANDTANPGDIPYQEHPLLPLTRAELTLPLEYGSRVIGVLDVQSTEPDRFQPDDLRTFQILADQIAIAIQNVRLMIQSEQRITQIDALNRQLTRTAWEDTSARSELDTVYRYDLLNLEQAEPPEEPALSLPIAIRGEVVGTIDAAPPEGQFFTEGDNVIMRAVADRVAIAIENARLFEEAQIQAQRALALAEAGQLSSRMSGDFVRSLEEVFARVAQAASYDRWSLALVNEARTALDMMIEEVPDDLKQAVIHPAITNLSLDFSPVVQCYRTGRAILINDPTRYPDPDGLVNRQPELFGKIVLTPVRMGDEVIGVLMVGRSLHAAALNESDEQLASTLAAQVAIAVENRRLFQAAEGERQRLSSILESLPAGVLVLDPITYRPIQYNNQIEHLLGRRIVQDQPFDVETYQIYRSGTNALYPPDSLPIFTVTRTKELVASDDIAVIQEDGSEIDLLMNAVPILNEDGSISAIVTALQDISALRNLERTLETNLRETVALYETTRGLAEAEEVDEVLDQVLMQLATLDASDAYVLLLDEATDGVEIARSLSGVSGAWALPGSVLNPRTMLFVREVRSDPELDTATRAALLEANIAALSSIPLRARSRRDVPIGWLVITFDTPQDFTPEREQFLSTLNDSAAVALDNRYLLRSTEQALQETAALYGATTNLSRARTDTEIAAALQSAFETLAPDMVAAYFTTEDRLTELFNVSLDSAPVDFGSLVEKHHLLDVANAFVEDLRDLPSPRPFERDLLALGNVRAFALVHLISLNMRIGCFVIAFHSPRAFSSRDVRYLNSVADSASVVVDNYLLLDQIQSSLEETSILYQASRALNDASTPSEILNVVVGHLMHRPITQVFLTLLSTENWDHPRAMAQVVATWQDENNPGIDLTGINLVAEQYPAWRLLASSEVLMIDDIATSEDLDVMERIGVESLEVASLSVLPLRIAGRSIGAIVVGGREPYHHSERDARIYRSLAEQASLRMEATRLLTQTERRARQLATSAEVSQIASSILDLNLLLPRIVDLIRDAFNYDHVQIFLMDENDTFAELRASTGEAGRQLLEIRHKLPKGSSSVIGRVTELGEATIASDTAETHVVHRPNPYLPNTRSEMAIPLKLKGQVVGALDVQSNQPNAFDDDDIQVSTALAAQISVAIDNAQLFEQARSRASEMSFLFDVTTAAASAETLQDAIQNVANELHRSLAALSVSIYLPQRYVNADETDFILLEPVALAGSDQPLSELSEVRLDSEDNLIAESARMRRPCIIDNAAAKQDYLPVVDGARSAIIVPLTSGVQLVGLVALESSALSAYGQDTLTLLLTLSGTLSAIIQNQQLLEQVQQTNEQLRELDRLKSDFLANMSHELRTPLNSIIGFSRVILKGIDGPLTEMQEQDLSTIYNSGLHLLNLINDILDQAKIAAGKMDLQFEYFEMKAVVDGVRSIGIGLVKDKPIDIFVDMAPGLPKVYGDEFRTRQILINLISNAAKFTRQGSITLSSYPIFDEESGRKMIRTDVTDTGIGIAEKDMPLLFEAFRQVDSSLTRTQGGTGLGLPISKSLVEMQGGRMLVSSRVNVGSTFSIVMPIEPVVEQEEKPKKKTTDHLGQPPQAGPKPVVTGILSLPDNGSNPYSTMETEPAPYQHTKRQILLIEDNPDMVDQFRRALQREGFDIFTASIPLEAEAMASGLHPTIIIMDVNFAAGQGWSILGKLKARDDTFDIPVVIVTLSSERERADALGAFRFIERPFTPDELIAAVQEAEADSRIERILIIDDQPESVRLLTQLLDEQGRYRVFSASSGAEGIALVARRRPNLVILDLRMPDMDGFQVVQELRNNPETATIPILVVTGDTLSTSEREQLTNLAVLHKGDISADEYRQFMDGVRAYLNGDS